MDYYAIELHAHTNHSDGSFTTEELLGRAQDFGYDILTITDHNTVAPYEEWKNNRHWSGRYAGHSRDRVDDLLRQYVGHRFEADD